MRIDSNHNVLGYVSVLLLAAVYPSPGPPTSFVGIQSMAVYVDDAIWHWRGLKWCHLLADDVDELHRFAARLGIKRTSFQSPPKVTVPHYDLTGYERLRAIAMGAVLCDRHQIVAVLRRMRPR